MKTILYTVFAAAVLMATACNQSPKEGNNDSKAVTTQDTTGGFPEMTFEQPEHDFGEIEQGAIMEYNFKFTNTGTKDLIIQDAITSCGCTVPEWPKEPIKPGATGFMKVVFNSKGKFGYQEKEITIKANTEDPLFPGPRIRCVIKSE